MDTKEHKGNPWDWDLRETSCPSGWIVLGKPIQKPSHYPLSCLHQFQLRQDPDQPLHPGGIEVVVVLDRQ